jgi:uncharacterized protein (TIGR03083 family)
MFDKEFFLDSFKREVYDFKLAIEKGSQPPLPQIPACPDWNTTGLLLHLGMVHRAVTQYVGNKELKPTSVKDNPALLQLKQPYLSWLFENKYPNEPIPADLITWFEEGANKLAKVLEQADPDEPIWFWGGDNRAEAWIKQMAFEAAIHRWDAEDAVGEAQEIQQRLAVEATEFQFKLLHHRRKRSKIIHPNGETYRFTPIDCQIGWSVSFFADDTKVTREYGSPDVFFKGTASDLLLYYWRRKGANSLEIKGSPELVDYFFELIPAV